MRLRRKNSTVRRGYLREAPLKKRGFKKFAVDCKKILEVLRVEGPCRYGKLREKTNIPKGTIDRRLWFLKDLRLIVNENRKWMLGAHAKTYENLEEYRIHLRHSRELANGLIAVFHFVPQIPPLSDVLTQEQREKLGLDIMPELWPYALQHLKTGYPDIFKIFERFKVVMDEIATIIMNETNAILDEVETESIMGRPVERRLRNAEMEKLSKLEEEKFEIMNELEDRITELILRIIHGEPLSGVCSLCPKVNVGKSLETRNKYT